MTQQLQINVPDYLREFYAGAAPSDLNEFTSGINAGRGPHISVEGGTTFSLVSSDGQPRAPLNPDGQMLFDPRRGPFIDVIVLAGNPGVLKRFYERGYVKGEGLPPDCFSNDGERPDPSVARPQNPICSGCRQNAFGTARGESEGKACSDRKRLAVLYLWDLKGPIYEYEVSPSNLKKWQAYAYDVASRVPGGVKSVVTRVYFEQGVQGGMLYEVAPQPNANANMPYPGGTGWWFCGSKMLPMLAEARESPECLRAIAVPAFAALPAPAPAQEQLRQQTGYVDTPVAPLAHPAQQQITQQEQPVQQQQPAAEAEQPKRRRRTREQIEAEEAALRAAQGGVIQAQQPVQQQPARQDNDPFSTDGIAGISGSQPAQQQPVQQQPVAQMVDAGIPGFLDRRQEAQQPAPQTGNVQFGVATGVQQTDSAMDAALEGMI